MGNYVNPPGDGFKPPSRFIKAAYKKVEPLVKGIIRQAAESLPPLKKGTEPRYKSMAPLTETGKFWQTAVRTRSAKYIKEKK